MDSTEAAHRAAKEAVYREMSTDYLKQRISGYGAVTSELSTRGYDPKLVDTGHDEINLMISELERRGELS